MVTESCTVLRLGLVDYLEAWELQKRLAQEVGDGRSRAWLLLLEHPHTYTLGVRAGDEHLLLAKEAFDRLGAKVHRVDRGGDVTYHGPGQLVGYPILNLLRWGAGPLLYVETLEATLIDALGALGVKAGRSEGCRGVWVGNEKIAAIGVKVSRGVTTHGFALNVDPDLAYFRHIVPCGLADAGVTTVRRVLGRRVRVDQAADAVVSAFGACFGLEMVEGEVSPAITGVAS
jgi:lipoyl(octanoyl) transferase